MGTLKLTYDGLGRVTSHLYRNAADSATIIGFVHDYDKVGNPEYNPPLDALLRQCYK